MAGMVLLAVAAFAVLAGLGFLLYRQSKPRIVPVKARPQARPASDLASVQQSRPLIPASKVKPARTRTAPPKKQPAPAAVPFKGETSALHTVEIAPSPIRELCHKATLEAARKLEHVRQKEVDDRRQMKAQRQLEAEQLALARKQAKEINLKKEEQQREVCLNLWLSQSVFLVSRVLPLQVY